MSDYIPDPAKVRFLMETNTHEQLAKAYLKASHRAKMSDLTGTLSDCITGIMMGLVKNDKDMVRSFAERGRRAVRTYEEIRK